MEKSLLRVLADHSTPGPCDPEGAQRPGRQCQAIPVAGVMLEPVGLLVCPVTKAELPRPQCRHGAALGGAGRPVRADDDGHIGPVLRPVEDVDPHPPAGASTLRIGNERSLTDQCLEGRQLGILGVLFCDIDPPDGRRQEGKRVPAGRLRALLSFLFQSGWERVGEALLLAPAILTADQVSSAHTHNC